MRFGAKDAKEKNKVSTQCSVHDFIRFSLSHKQTQLKQYDMVMDDQISFVLAETVAGNREKEVYVSTSYVSIIIWYCIGEICWT